MSSSGPAEYDSLNLDAAYRVITDSGEAARALALLETEAVIGLDTETYWDSQANHSRVSLVQIAARAGEILVIDLLEVEASDSTADCRIAFRHDGRAQRAL